jgi:hypothetical protein
LPVIVSLLRIVKAIFKFRGSVNLDVTGRLNDHDHNVSSLGINPEG